jgi:hypothetical protein
MMQKERPNKHQQAASALAIFLHASSSLSVTKQQYLEKEMEEMWIG